MACSNTGGSRRRISGSSPGPHVRKESGGRFWDGVSSPLPKARRRSCRACAYLIPPHPWATGSSTAGLWRRSPQTSSPNRRACFAASAASPARPALHHPRRESGFSCGLPFRDGRLGDGQANDESRPFPSFGFESEGAAVLFDHHGVGDRQALAGAFADRFGGKERLEDSVPDFFRNNLAGAADWAFRPITAN